MDVPWQYLHLLPEGAAGSRLLSISERKKKKNTFFPPHHGNTLTIIASLEELWCMLVTSYFHFANRGSIFKIAVCLFTGFQQWSRHTPTSRWQLASIMKASQKEEDCMLHGEINRKLPLWWIVPTKRWLESKEQIIVETGITLAMTCIKITWNPEGSRNTSIVLSKPWYFGLKLTNKFQFLTLIFENSIIIFYHILYAKYICE